MTSDAVVQGDGVVLMMISQLDRPMKGQNLTNTNITAYTHTTTGSLPLMCVCIMSMQTNTQTYLKGIPMSK